MNFLTTGGTLYALTMGGVPIDTQITNLGSIITSPLVADEHLYIRSQTHGLKSFGGGRYNNPILTGGFAELQIKGWREMF